MIDTKAEAALDDVFFALADPTRRAMIEELTHGPKSVGALSQPFAVSAPAISRHLRVLEVAGLITRIKVGRVMYCRLEASPLDRVDRWLAEDKSFWETQLDSLADFLAEEGERWRSAKRSAARRSGSSAGSRRCGSASSKRGPRQKR